MDRLYSRWSRAEDIAPGFSVTRMETGRFHQRWSSRPTACTCRTDRLSLYTGSLIQFHIHRDCSAPHLIEFCKEIELIQPWSFVNARKDDGSSSGKRKLKILRPAPSYPPIHLLVKLWLQENDKYNKNTSAWSQENDITCLEGPVRM